MTNAFTFPAFQRSSVSRRCHSGNGMYIRRSLRNITGIEELKGSDSVMSGP